MLYWKFIHCLGEMYETEAYSWKQLWQLNLNVKAIKEMVLALTHISNTLFSLGQGLRLGRRDCPLTHRRGGTAGPRSEGRKHRDLGAGPGQRRGAARLPPSRSAPRRAGRPPAPERPCWQLFPRAAPCRPGRTEAFGPNLETSENSPARGQSGPPPPGGAARRGPPHPSCIITELFARHKVSSFTALQTGDTKDLQLTSYNLNCIPYDKNLCLINE